MNSTRVWIVLLTLVAFLAGVGSGLFIAERKAQDQGLTAEFGVFEQAFVAEFSLDPQRQQLLAGLLDHYNRDRQQIKDRYAAGNHREMEPELRTLGLEYRSHLRDRLLPESQRLKFDRLMASYEETL